MTRILWVSAETPNEHGQGGQRRQYHQIKALLKIGHEISVLTLASTQSDESLREIVGDVRRVPIAVKGIVIPGLRRALRRAIFRNPAEVVVTSHLESMWMLPPRRQAGRRYLVDVHNVMSDWNFRQGYIEQGTQALASEQLALDQSDAVTTCSDVECRRLLDRHPQHRAEVFTAPLGVDPAEWPEAKYSRDNPLVALFGSWDWRPNALGLQWFTQEVWPRVTELVPSARAEIAGSGVSLRAVPKGLSIVGRVDSLPQFCAQATVVAIPVITGVERQ